ncbi:unnamed protein product [Victoria cruziana]
MGDRRSPFFCCFRCRHDSDEAEPEPASRCPCRPSTWLRRRALQLPALKQKCRSLLKKIEKEGAAGMCLSRRGRHSGEFGYDILSYSLNFDDETPNEESRQPHDFSARFVLPPATAGKHGHALGCPALPAASTMDRG